MIIKAQKLVNIVIVYSSGFKKVFLWLNSKPYEIVFYDGQGLRNTRCLYTTNKVIAYSVIYKFFI